jgi:hypothetical protein
MGFMGQGDEHPFHAQSGGLSGTLSKHDMLFFAEEDYVIF